MNKIILTLVALLCMATMAYAVPSLGVGSSTGYFNASAADAYQTYWGGSISAPANEDGFAIGASGSNLHVWSNILNANIYILTTSDVGTGNNINFNGSVHIYDETGTFRSYDPVPYYGINLGSVNTSTWAALPKNPFTPGSFYSMDVKVTYTGEIGFDQWIFAAADTNGVDGLQAKSGSKWVDDNGKAGIQEQDVTIWVDSNLLPGIQEKKGKTKINGNWVTYLADSSTTYEADTFTHYQGDDSSPKTTSARGYEPPPPAVPEPGTLMLLGVGMFSLAIFGKRRMNKNY